MESMKNNEAHVLAIGEVARASGLSVSALRFYDRQGVLTPVHVDSSTGYRWYARAQLAEAKLLARLRRIGLPLAEISTILARGEAMVTRRLLGEHISSLEARLAASRADVSLLNKQLDDGRVTAPGLTSGDSAESFHATLDSTQLLRGLRTVAHAVGSDPDWPAIHGVFCVAVGRGIRLSATDRRRAAFAEVPAETSGRMRALLPTAEADRLLTVGLGSGELRLDAETGQLHLRNVVGDTLFETHLQEAAFPDLSHAIPAGRGGSALIGADELLQLLSQHPETDLWALSRCGEDLRAEPARSIAPGNEAVVVSRSYLVEALTGLTGHCEVPDRLRFDFDGPADALAIRLAENLGTFAVLVPVVPEGTA